MSVSPDTSERREPQAADSGSALPFVLAGVVLIAMLYGGWKWWQVRQFEAARANSLPASRVSIPLSEFELTERSGNPFRSADMHGKVWVVNYFFSTCPGTCLTVSRNIARLNRRSDLSEVTWVSITCDPDNDTVEVLQNYAKQWAADPGRWLFCRGDFEYTKGVARGMKIALAMKMHADHAVVIDKTGTIRGMFDATSNFECDRMRTLLRECLAEEAPDDVKTVETEDSEDTAN